MGKFCFDKSRNEILSAAFSVFSNRKVLHPPRSIYIFFYFPFKLNEWPIKGIKRQSCISRPEIDTEIRLVTKFLDFLIYEIERYFCRLWYRGQPLVCNLCCTQGQKSADCPDKDECRRCGQLWDFYLGLGTCAFCWKCFRWISVSAFVLWWRLLASSAVASSEPHLPGSILQSASKTTVVVSLHSGAPLRGVFETALVSSSSPPPQSELRQKRIGRGERGGLKVLLTLVPMMRLKMAILSP